MPAERLVLVGAGDHGRGVLEILRRRQRDGDPVEVAGFVDDDPSRGPVDGVPVLGTTEWLEAKLPGLDAALILALADPAAKAALSARLGRRGARWGAAVHPRAEVAPSVVLGPGAVINAGAVLVYEARLGAHVTVNLGATIGHHVVIGDHATVAPGANVLGKVILGEGAQVHANAVVLPGIRIGAAAVVGAGAVALRDVPDGVTVFGNPARPVPRPG